MDFKVIWSLSAREDLRTIISYIAEDDPARAETLGKALIEASQSLTGFEKKGRKVPEFESEDIRELILPPFRMIYLLSLENATVQVVRIWHGARGEPKLGPDEEHQH